MEYAQDPRRAFQQWRRAYARWQDALWHWQWRWRWLEREHYDRKVLGVYPTVEAFGQMLRALRQERRALRAERPKPPSRPAQCRGLVCGARTRWGTPCQRRDLGAGARCRLHGGLSTGPTSAAGKRRVALNGLQPKRSKPHAGRTAEGELAALARLVDQLARLCGPRPTGVSQS
jgi:hypothetical protein